MSRWLVRIGDRHWTIAESSKADPRKLVQACRIAWTGSPT